MGKWSEQCSRLGLTIRSTGKSHISLSLTLVVVRAYRMQSRLIKYQLDEEATSLRTQSLLTKAFTALRVPLRDRAAADPSLEENVV